MPHPMISKQMLRDERGVSPIIEATIYLPFCIIAVMALLYATVFLGVKASMQTALQTSLIYYKNQESDTYIYVNPDRSVGQGEKKYNIDKYDLDTVNSGYPFGVKNPFRLIFMKFDEGGCADLARGFAGHMFYADMGSVAFDAYRENYVLCKKISVSSTASMPAFSGTGRRVLSSSATMVVTDGDQMIRTTDFIMDISGLGDKRDEALGKVEEIYEKFRDRLVK